MKAFTKFEPANLANMPVALKTGNRYVAWKVVLRDGNPTKVPVNLWGVETDITNPQKLSDLDSVVAMVAARDDLKGVGRAFIPEDGLVGIDFDNARDPETGEPTEFAKTWLLRFNTYSEVSPSQSGYKLWCRGEIPGERRRNTKLGVEVYSDKRFFTLTGHRLDHLSHEVEARQAVLDEFYEEVFGKDDISSTTSTANGTENRRAIWYETTTVAGRQVVTPRVPTDDEIIMRASTAENGEKFKALWAGDFEAAGFTSHSEADLALASILGFWCCGDRPRIEALFTKSGLARDKWNSRPDYRQRTIAKAVSNGEFYQPAGATATVVFKSGSTVTATNVAPPAPSPLPVIRTLDSFTMGEDNGGCLLGNRFLNRQGDWLFAAPTGVGKSCLVLQASTRWALGLDFLGIYPAQKLKSLIIQSENDDGDISHVREGVFRFLVLSDAERIEVCQNVRIVSESATTGTMFVAMIDRLLAQCQADGWMPDLLWIDPLFGYLGNDVSNQAAVSAFVRAGMKPLLQKYQIAEIMLHHTNKPSMSKDSKALKGSDTAYLGSGSIELANAFRAGAGLVSVGEHGRFKWVFGKRGALAGITDTEGNAVFEFMVKWADKEMGIGFELDSNPSNTTTASVPQVADLLRLVTAATPISKAQLMLDAGTAKISQHRFRSLLAVALDDGLVEEIDIPRPGKKSGKGIIRTEAGNARLVSGNQFNNDTTREESRRDNPGSQNDICQDSLLVDAGENPGAPVSPLRETGSAPGFSTNPDENPGPNAGDGKIVSVDKSNSKDNTMRPASLFYDLSWEDLARGGAK